MLYSASQKGPFKVSTPYDPDSITTITVTFRPLTWQAATVYRYINSEEYDIVLPTTYKGYYYKCINGGKSGSTEPTWALEGGETITDFESGATQGLTWQAVPYNLLVPALDVDTVTFSQTNDVTLVSSSNTTTKATFTIDTIAADADARTLKSFQVRLRAILSNGESRDFTIQWKLAER